MTRVDAPMQFNREPSAFAETVALEQITSKLDFRTVTPDSAVEIDLRSHPDASGQLAWDRYRFTSRMKAYVGRAAVQFHLCQLAQHVDPDCKTVNDFLQLYSKISMSISTPRAAVGYSRWSVKHKISWGEYFYNVRHSYETRIRIRYHFLEHDVRHLTLQDLSAEMVDEIPFIAEVGIIGVDVPKAVPIAYNCTEESYVSPLQYNPDKHGRVISTEYENIQVILIEDVNVDYDERPTPRRLPMRVYQAEVGKYDIGDRIKLMGLYSVEEAQHPKSIKPRDYYVQALNLEKLSKEQEIRIDPEHLEIFGRDRGELGANDFLIELTKSMAPHISGNHIPKLLCLLCAVGSTPIGEYRHQIHGLLVGNPGSGKSEMIKAIAKLRYKGTYADAPSTSSRGLTYAQDEFQTYKILKAGLMLRHEFVALDELDKMNATHRREVNTVLEQQKAIYTKASFNAETNTNVTLLAASNPQYVRWKDSLSIMDNIHPVTPDLVSRMIVVRVHPNHDMNAQLDHIFAHIQNKKESRPRYTEEQMAGFISHVRKKSPPIDPSAITKIKEFLSKFNQISQAEEADLPMDVRQWIDIARVSTGIAKLLLKNTADAECASIAVEFYRQTLESLGMQVSEAPTQMNLTTSIKDKESVFWELVRMLEQSNPEGIDETELIKEMIRSEKWKEPALARKLWEKMRGEYFYEETVGRFKRI